MDTALLIVGTLLLVVQILAWIVLPTSKKVSESSPEFSSIGDETKTKAVV